MKEITYTNYCNLLLQRIKLNTLAYLNCDIPEDLKGVRYFLSKEGISFLKPDGYMGGLCRIKEGSENISYEHQYYRRMLGGFFLDCYDGKLVELYEKQGFLKVASTPFVPELAKEGWEDSILSNKPEVTLMSTLVKDFKLSYNYELAYEYAASRYRFLVMQNRTNLDKLVHETYSLTKALNFLDRGCVHIESITEGYESTDFYIKDSKAIVRKSQFKLNKNY